MQGLMLKTDLLKKPRVKANDLMISMYQTGMGNFDINNRRKKANYSET